MPTYKRIAQVRDLEYLIAFLHGLEKGGIEEAEKAVKNVLMEFEKEKDRAVGLGRKIGEKKLRLKSLLAECARMARELGLVTKNTLCVRLEDREVKILMTNDIHNKDCRGIWIKRFLMTYGSFEEMLFRIRSTPQGKILVSHDREKSRFEKSIERHNFNIKSQWTFEVTRDLATQLGLLNWRMLDDQELAVDPKLGKTGYVVYLVCTIAKLSEVQRLDVNRLFTGFEAFCLNSIYEEAMEKGELARNPSVKAEETDYLLIDCPNDKLFIKAIKVNDKKLCDVLWKEYLKLSGYVPGEPVYYSILRDNVCEVLQISDSLFDSLIQSMLKNRNNLELKVTAGSGTLPLEIVTSRKHIPPRLASDIYIVYLLIERFGRNCVAGA